MSVSHFFLSHEHSSVGLTNLDSFFCNVRSAFACPALNFLWFYVSECGRNSKVLFFSLSPCSPWLGSLSKSFLWEKERFHFCPFLFGILNLRKRKMEQNSQRGSFNISFFLICPLWERKTGMLPPRYKDIFFFFSPSLSMQKCRICGPHTKIRSREEKACKHRPERNAKNKRTKEEKGG